MRTTSCPGDIRKSRPRAESSNCAAVFAHLNLQQLSQRPRLHEDKLIQGHAQNVDRWNGKRNDCNRLRLLGGSPQPHNASFTFSIVLIELSRVLDSPFYSQSPRRSKDAGRIRFLIPLLVSRQQRYFVNLRSGVNTHIEDAGHGSMDMIYLEVLHRNLGRPMLRPSDPTNL